MKAMRVQLAETSLERYARLVAGRNNIRVVFKGNSAHTIGDVITLPAVPTDAPDWYVETLTGYLDAEIAKILYTEISPEMMEKFNQDDLLHTCFSRVETLRGQNRFRDVYPGAAVSLNAFHTFQAKMLKQNWHERAKIQQVLAAMELTITYGKGELYGKYLDGETRRLVDEAIRIVGDLNELTCTEDSIPVGEQLRDLLLELLPPPGSTTEQEKSGDNQDNQDEDNFGEQLAEQLGLPEEPPEEDDSEEEEAPGKKPEIQPFDHYRIYTTEHDSIQDSSTIPLSEGGMDLNAFRSEANRYVGVVKQRITNSLRTITMTRHSYGHEDGDLDTDALAALATKSDCRVFQQKEPKVEINTAVAIAIDHSRSMAASGKSQASKIKLAAQCAITLGDVLSAVKVPVLVYGYSTHDIQYNPTPTKEDFADYSRWGALWLRLYADFHRPWREGALKLCQAPANIQAGSFDGESVLYGIRRLLERKEKRKILFVLSDGQPQPGAGGNDERHKSYLKAVVEAGMKAGVEIVGFGLASPSITTYYPVSVNLNKFEDIVKEPLNVIDSALRKGRKLG